MFKIFILGSLLFGFVFANAQITGDNTPSYNVNTTYTFDNGFLQFGGVDWTVTGGTVVSSSGPAPSTTEYEAVIKFTSGGSQTITAKNGMSGTTLATKNVTADYPPLVAGSIGNAQTLCHNGNPSTLTNTASASGGNGSYTYQWQSKCALGGCGWSNISGATGTTYNPPALTSTVQYRRRVISNGSTKYTNTITVTIQSALSAGSISNAQTLCYNGNPSALTNTSSASGGWGTISYQWQYSLNGSSEWTNVSGGTGSTHNPGALTASTWYRRRAKSSNCSAYAYTGSVKITIQPNISAGSISGAQTICYNTDPSNMSSTSSASGGWGNYSYQWQSSTTGSGSWLNIPGETGSSYNSATALTANMWYRRRVESSNCSGAYAYTSSVKVTVQGDLTAGSIGGTQTICYDTDPGNLTNTTSPTGGYGSYEYQWQYSLTGSDPWYDRSGATSSTYDPTLDLTSDRWYRRRVKSANCTGYEYTSSVKVTVSSDLSPGTIDNPQSICNGDNPASLTSTSGASGGYGSPEYQWQYSLDGSTGWTNIGSATNATYDPGVLTADRWYRRTVNSSNCSDTKETSTVKITVVDPPAMGTINGTTSFCSSGTLNLTHSENNSFAKWQKYNTGTSQWEDVLDEFDQIIYGNQTLTDPAYNSDQYRVFLTHATCGDIWTSTSTIVVDDATPGTVTAAKTSFVNLGTGTLTLSYHSGTIDKWEKKTTGAWEEVPSSAGLTVLPFTDIDEDTQYQAIVSGTVCAATSSNAVSINIDYKHFTGYLTGDLTNDAVDSTISVTINSHDGTINWYYATDADTSAWQSTAQTGTTFTKDVSGKDVYVRAKVTKDGFVEYTPVHTVTWLEPGDTNLPSENYVKKMTPLTAVTTETALNNLDSSQVVVSYAYVDGIGRATQSVNKASTPGGKDVISFTDYDNLGRSTRSYLPYVSSNSDYYSGVISAQASYYTSPPTGVASSSYPWADTEFDDAGRVDKQAAPGTDWKLGSGHEVEFAYAFNSASEVIDWGDDGVSTAYYAANTLIKNTTTDENNNRVITFGDTRGNQILKQVETATNTWAKTYHIYDHAGRLKYTLPPEAVEELGAGASHSVDTTSAIAELIYTYAYDDEGKVIERKVPGKGKEHLVYDPLDRVAMTQDAIMDGSDLWSFTKYDRRGRVVYSGLVENDTTRTQLQAKFDGLDYTSDPYFEERTANTHGYTNTVYPTQSLEEHVVNYYDDYDFNRNDTTDYTLDTVHLTGQGTDQLDYTRGVATGSKTRILGTNNWLKGVNFYDDEGRVLQSQGSNHRNLSVQDKATFKYQDFTNEVLEGKSTIITDEDTVEVQKKYTYDNRKRLTKTEHKLNDEDWVNLTGLDYNELGQLLEKNLHFSNDDTLQSIDYGYNIRGWLTSINDSDLSDGEADAFGQEFLYSTVDSGVGNTASYNGNISGAKWSAYEPDDSGITERGYGYTYDGADRMTAATHKKKNVTWSGGGALDVSGVQYDKNGNMTALTRKDGSASTMDNLTYTYTDNQLMQVSDAGNDDEGFGDGNTSGDDYAYDVNGNLIRDLNKGIDTIYYNHLDLPIKIELADTTQADSLTYLYDASGNKLSMSIWKDNGEVAEVDYVGGMRYENDTLRTISHEEGRIVRHPELVSGSEWDYQYNLTDHQGNTRRILSTTPDIFETTATMEDTVSTEEEAIFFNLPATRVSSTPANNTPGGSKAARINSNNPIGPSTVMKVDKGDTISLSAYAYYEGGSGYSSALTESAIISALGGTFNTASALGEFTATIIDDGIDDAITTLGVGGSSDDNVPGAYINYIQYDKDMNYVTGGFEQISSSANLSKELVEIENVIMDRAGYVMAYVSNESNSTNYVYFDDFTVEHRKTNVVQAMDYYPFGMEATVFNRSSFEDHNFEGIPVDTASIELSLAFSGNANDDSGNSRNGTVNGASLTSDKDSNSNSAYSFDGTNDFIDLTSHDAAFSSLDEGSISVWFKADSSSIGVLVGIGDESDENFSIMVGGDMTGYVTDESIMIQHRSNGWNLLSYVRNGDHYYNDEQWHHLAYVVSGTSNRIYIDGVKQEMTYTYGSDTTSGYFMNVSSDSLGIGRRFYPSSPEYFEGSIDEVNIYSRELTGGEISALANGIRPNEEATMRYLSGQNKYLYNAGAELNSLTGYYETFYRQYDASIGRFTGIDPLASSFASQTPYNYAYNDPVYWNDPLGDCGICNAWGIVGADDPHAASSWFDRGDNEDLINAQIQVTKDLAMAQHGGMTKEEYAEKYGEKGQNAIDFFVSSFDYLEIHKGDMQADGSVISWGDDFQVHDDPAIMAGVMDYYLNKFQKSEDEEGESSHDDELIDFGTDDPRNLFNEGVLTEFSDGKFGIQVTGVGPDIGRGTVVKAAANAKKVVVIGEDMVRRVIPYAKKIGATWFKPTGNNPLNYMRNQVQWIRRQIKDPNTTIIDLGSKGAKPTSPYYKKELKMLEKWLNKKGG